MSSNQPRDVDFEAHARNYDIVAIATTWRNSPEYVAWMTLFTENNENNFVKVFEGENDQVVTFYRDLTDAEIKRAHEEQAELEKVAAEPEKPKQFEELEVIHEHDNGTETHKVTHVKLGIPRWIPWNDGRFALCEYVLVDQYKNTVSDDAGQSFEFRSTRVFVSDEEQNDVSGGKDGIDHIYVAPSYMDVWEVMYAIGELPPFDPFADEPNVTSIQQATNTDTPSNSESE